MQGRVLAVLACSPDRCPLPEPIRTECVTIRGTVHSDLGGSLIPHDREDEPVCDSSLRSLSSKALAALKACFELLRYIESGPVVVMVL